MGMNDCDKCGGKGWFMGYQGNGEFGPIDCKGCDGFGNTI